MSTQQHDTSANPSGKRSGSLIANEKSWLDYLYIVREHWILGLLVAFSLSGLYAYKQLQTVPLYKSVAILLFELQQDRVINIQQVVDTSLGRSTEFILRNHLTDLRSNSFLNRVVDSLTPEEADLITKDYLDKDADVEDAEDEDAPSINKIISDANNIALVAGNIFMFEFHHRNPQAAALLANRFSEEFTDFLLERSRKTNDSALRFLRSQSEELKLKVERSELAVQRYRQERNLVSLEESQNLIVGRMKNLSNSLNDAKIELLNLSATIEKIREADGDLDKLAKLPSINQMGTLPSRFESRNKLLAERNSLSLRYGRRHPQMIENTSSLEVVESEIQVALQKNVSDFVEKHSQLQSRVASLEEALGQAEQESLELDQVAIEYNVLRRKLETDKRLFTQVHQRLNEAILASQLNDVNLRVVDRAWPTSKAFTPDVKKIYSVTTFLFFCVFVGVPFGIHYLNLNLKTASDIEQQLRVPFLGEIRAFSSRHKNLHRVVLDQADPEAAELFRQIHSQILLKIKKIEPGHTFVVTSAIPKEGKSFFSINLTASFARHHYKTLLLDCDFRRPSIGKLLEADVVEELKSHEDLKTPFILAENFHVLPFKNSTVEATELIESKLFRQRIEAFQEQYDIVIIDTAPAGLFPDASLIGNYAHSLIFLTQINKHRRAMLKAIFNRLGQSKAEILGVVVNKVSRSTSRNLGTYKYADYGKYKSYYPHPTGKKSGDS